MAKTKTIIPIQYEEGACSKVWYNTGLIYTLSTLSGEVFYVGCTTVDIDKRLMGHITEARAQSFEKKQTDKNAKIIELNYEVAITIIDSMILVRWDSAKLRKVESSYIKKYIQDGVRLTNREYKTHIKPLAPTAVGSKLIYSNNQVQSL